MTVAERNRRELQEALVRSLGTGPADTLVGYLPPVGWADVATKDDLATLQTVLRAEMAEQFGSVRAEMAEQFGNVRAEMAEQFGNVRAESAEQFGGLKAWVHDELRVQFYWTATLLVLLLGGFVAALKLA